ncbi:helix-turn-helix domain-containing protein [Brucella intermedia]
MTNIAIDLGYESSSAFIAMFRRMLGTTPARYLTETAIGDERRDLDE